MKRKWAGMRIVITICAAISWWGILYPELTMTPDTYKIVQEGEAVQSDENMIEWDSDSNMYQTILKTDGSRIRFKSKLFTQLEALMGKLK